MIDVNITFSEVNEREDFLDTVITQQWENYCSWLGMPAVEAVKTGDERKLAYIEHVTASNLVTLALNAKLEQQAAKLRESIVKDNSLTVKDKR